jgi:FixJ family two-component response regulator
MSLIPGSTVYVVDDDESVREGLSSLLRSAGFRVELFPSAQAFLERPGDPCPGCLVLDVNLPGLSGLELQTRLADRQAALPIIFITGHGDIPMSVRAMKAGAAEFLTKPFSDRVLLDAVEQAIEKSRAAWRDRTALAGLQARYEALTPREREVLAHVVAGRLNKQIAGQLGTSEVTVKVHRGRVMEKMQAASVADLVKMAGRLGLPPA